MTLTSQQIQAIETEYKEFEAQQYAGKDKKDRQSKGQFFTSPPLTIKMLEKFDSVEDKDILDPACGAAGLLVAAIIAGADPKRVYGIELDPVICQLARKRLAKYGVPARHIKCANALDSDAYEDFDDYEDNCDKLAEKEKLKNKSEDIGNREKKEEKKSLEKKQKANKLQSEVKIKKVNHDQNALLIQQLYGKLEVHEITFPDTIGKRLNLKNNKRADLLKVAEVFKEKVNSGYWLICNEDIKNSLDVQFKLYDISYAIPEDKIINDNIGIIKNIASKQKFNSYDDISKFLK